MRDTTLTTEQARQRTLDGYHLLDTLPEASYDDIVRIASQLCGVPSALISLVDGDRQWFKARVGLDIRQTPRDIAFCDHAIRAPTEPMVVEDATEDARFSQNPLVTGETGIRFYAGVPLQAANGDALGTVCVIDQVPRSLTDAQLAGLQALARLTVVLMDAHRDRLLHLRQDGDRAFRAGAPKAPAAEKAGNAIRAVAICQIAELSSVQDTVGDNGVVALLADLESAIRAELSAADIVGPHGANELLVVLADADDVPEKLSRIHRAAGSIAALADATAIFGAAVAQDTDQTMENMFLRADEALSEARASAGDRVVIVDA